MDSPTFTIETTMEPQDYRTFLFIATFLRNPLTIPIIAGIACLGACLFAWSNNSFAVVPILSMWIFMFVIAIGVICFKVERKNKQRIRTDKTGTFGSKSILKFFDDRIVMETPSLQGTCTLYYNQFFQLLENKDYLIFYLNKNQAFLIRKKDLSNPNEFLPFITKKFENKYKRIFSFK